MKAFELKMTDCEKVAVLYIPIFYTVKQLNHCLKIVFNTREDNELSAKSIHKEEEERIAVGAKSVYSYSSKVEYFTFKTKQISYKIKFQGIKDIHGSKPLLIGSLKEKNKVTPLSFHKINQELQQLSYRPKHTITKSYETRLLKMIKRFIDLNYFYYSRDDSVFKMHIPALDKTVYVLIRKENDDNGHIDFLFNENDVYTYLNSLAIPKMNNDIYYEKISIDLIDIYNKPDFECLQSVIDSYYLQIYHSKPGMSDYIITNQQAKEILHILHLLMDGLECIMESGNQGNVDNFITLTYNEEGILLSFNEEELNEDTFFNQFLLDDQELIVQCIDFNKITDMYQIDIVNYDNNKRERYTSVPRPAKIIVANSEICVIRDVMDFSITSLFNQVVSTLLDTIIINGVPEVIQTNNLNILAFISDLCLLLHSQEELNFKLDYVEEAYFYELENRDEFLSASFISSLEEIKDLLDTIDDEDTIIDHKLLN